MLFNSPEFLFLFLPLTVLGYFAVWRGGNHASAKFFLVLASLFFYGGWNPLNLWIIGVSIVCNYYMGHTLISGGRSLSKPARTFWLVGGIVFNLGLLGYFKYLNFSIDAFNVAFDTHFVIGQILLPLGISFFTFQQIAFLVDAKSGQIEQPKFIDYALFVTFFPQLIAGPIVHFREMMPQFSQPAQKGFSSVDLAVGLTLFLMGLFKKVVLADMMMFYSSAPFASAALGNSVQFFEAWGAATAFTLQLYFDFSGYSDMAVGLGRMVGIRIPLNFNSPYKAASIIEFWTRWHMTLTRFINAYVYNPIILKLTRRRMGRGVPVLSKGVPTPGVFVVMIAFPTLVTMFLIGLWHGASYTFALLGIFHGCALIINHGWRAICSRVGLVAGKWAGSARVIAVGLTFLTVTTSFVLFRAENLLAAQNMYEAMMCLNGIAYPPKLMAMLNAIGLGFAAPARAFADYQFAWTVGLLGVVFLAPNSQQILATYLNRSGELADGDTGRKQSFYPTLAHGPNRVVWRPNAFWGVCLGAAAFYAMFHISDPSAFLYFNF